MDRGILVVLTFVRVVVGLLDKSQLFTLGLIETPFDTIRFLQLFQGQDQRHSRERNRRELATLEPMHSRSVDRYCFVCADVRSVRKLCVLTLLLSLQVDSCQAT